MSRRRGALVAVVTLLFVHGASARAGSFFSWLPDALTSDAPPASGSASSAKIGARRDDADDADAAADDDDGDDDYAPRVTRRKKPQSTRGGSSKRAPPPPPNSAPIMQNIQFAGASMIVTTIGVVILYKTVGFAGSIAVQLMSFIPLYILCRFLEWSLLSTLHRFEPLLRIMAFLHV